MDNSLKISIITATYNAVNYLDDCLDSLRCQTKNIEHIVIDGASTDGTLSLLQEKGLSNMKILSEKDGSMYEAMNKGIQLGEGAVIGILNADDTYDSPYVLETVAKLFTDTDVDACYGDLVYVQQDEPEKIVRYWKAGEYNPKKFYWGWMPPHPTFFVKKKIYDNLGVFNLTMGSAADYELMLRFLLKKRVHVQYLPEILVRMRTGGISNSSISNRLRANRMDRKAWVINNLRPYPWTILFKPLRKLPQWFKTG